MGDQAIKSVQRDKPTAHIIGAGIAGLSAGMHLTKAGYQIHLHERSNMLGGRCRSFEDAQLGCLIDNGNHLMMSGNTDILSLVELAGASDRLLMGADATYRFAEPATGKSWALAMDDGRWPGWLFDPDRRVPDSRPMDYLGLLKIMLAGKSARLGDLLPDGSMMDRFWEPLILAVLNLPVAEADAGLMRQVLKETVLRGGRYARPVIAKDGLGPDIVKPMAAWLEGEGAQIDFRGDIRQLTKNHHRVTAVERGDGVEITLGDRDAVVLAIPPMAASRLVPDLPVPEEGEPIFNLHFRLPDYQAPKDDTVPVVGLVGTTAQWVFLRDGLISVTVSAARHLPPGDDETLAASIWAEIAPVLDLVGQSLPAYRVIREKRATFTQTPDNVAMRPRAVTGWRNLFIAGDWTDTGLPATIEGAARSGRLAADAVVKYAA